MLLRLLPEARFDLRHLPRDWTVERERRTWTVSRDTRFPDTDVDAVERGIALLTTFATSPPSLIRRFEKETHPRVREQLVRLAIGSEDEDERRAMAEACKRDPDATVAALAGGFIADAGAISVEGDGGAVSLDDKK